MKKFNFLQYGLFFVLVLCLLLRIFYYPLAPWGPGNFVSITAKVSEPPAVYLDSFDAYPVQKISVEHSGQVLSFYYSDSMSVLRVGDTIEVSGVVEQIDNSTYLLPLLHSQEWSIKPVDSLRVLSVVKKGDRFWESLDWVKQTVISQFKLRLNSKEAAILSGLVFGEKELLSEDFQEMLRRSGMIHVVVASGFNVMVIGIFVINILINFVKRKIAIILSIFITWGYVLMVGSDPPVVRAGVMFSLAMVGILIGRFRDVGYIFVYTIICILLFQPLWINSISMQLSTVATAALIWVLPILRDKTSLFFINILNHPICIRFSIVKSCIVILRESLLTSLAAQIAVLPLSIYYFGNVSIIAPISNTLLIGFVPIFTIAGMVASLFCVVLPVLADLLLLLLFPFLTLFVQAIYLFGDLSFALMGINLQSRIFVVAYFIGVSCIVRKYINAYAKD